LLELIASEVIESGQSNGWQGSVEERAQVEKILSKYNIAYVDDLFGRWGYGEVAADI
jgi:hypothetical protein